LVLQDFRGLVVLNYEFDLNRSCEGVIESECDCDVVSLLCVVVSRFRSSVNRSNLESLNMKVTDPSCLHEEELFKDVGWLVQRVIVLSSLTTDGYESEYNPSTMGYD
jgi:hypothetical protein